MAQLRYYPIASDSGVFTKNGTYIAVYVDDLLIVGNNKAQIKALKDVLSARFQMTDLGPCNFYLGI